MQKGYGSGRMSSCPGRMRSEASLFTVISSANCTRCFRARSHKVSPGRTITVRSDEDGGAPVETGRSSAPSVLDTASSTVESLRLSLAADFCAPALSSANSLACFSTAASMACRRAMEAAVEKQARELAELKAGAQKSAARLKRKLSTVELAVSSTEGALDRPVSTGAPPSSSLRTVIVRPGDTLWDLARKHRVQLAELMTVNKLASDRIRPGQELILPEP